MKLGRRELLEGAGALVILVPVACGGDGNTGGSGGAGGTTTRAGGEGGGVPVSCTLTPQQTEGPFYLDDDLVRTDIREGKPGVPLTMNILVVQMPDCTPIADAPVDIWHADHQGWYSGFPGQGDAGNVDTSGETFLRGTAISDAQGRVSFTTIYPGWYPGRAIHIHFKVHLPGNMEVTSQLYFPDAVNQAVHTEAPYSAHGPVATNNGQDGIFASTPNGDRLVADTAPDGGGYSATLAIGIA